MFTKLWITFHNSSIYIVSLLSLKFSLWGKFFPYSEHSYGFSLVLGVHWYSRRCMMFDENFYCEQLYALLLVVDWSSLMGNKAECMFEGACTCGPCAHFFLFMEIPILRNTGFISLIICLVSIPCLWSFTILSTPSCAGSKTRHVLRQKFFPHSINVYIWILCCGLRLDLWQKTFVQRYSYNQGSYSFYLLCGLWLGFHGSLPVTFWKRPPVMNGTLSP